MPGVLLGLGLTGPFLKLGSSGQFLRNAVKARESPAGFLALPPVGRTGEPRTPAGHEVGFEQVSFSYDGEHRVLRDIAAPGTAAVVLSVLAHPRFRAVGEGMETPLISRQ
ncbi:hypothetical protein [Paractinoplanes aksuensis]|uniref:hypothetical protein n=1 Tax=Paractinoplanes aksuensis TaxID=2939490 RepID=UPI003F693FEF